MEENRFSLCPNFLIFIVMVTEYVKFGAYDNEWFMIVSNLNYSKKSMLRY